MIIGITGTLAAGKGTIVDYLKQKGFKHYSVREFLIEEIKRLGLEINRDSMVLVANELRERNSPSFIVEELYKRAKLINEDVIIESLRTPGEVKSLKKEKDFFLFAIDANPDIRYSRAIERASETDNIDFETFITNEKREWTNTDPSKQNIKECVEMADFRFQNNGTMEELFEKVNRVLEKIDQFSKNKKQEVSARKDYISWDEYFMGIALLSAQRSKDPSTQVGACIVDEQNRIVGAGYNGAPRGMLDDDFPWAREGDFENTKYAYVCHAELNAILNSTKESLNGCTIYVALFPCNECAKAIVQSGIKRVVYLSDKYADLPSSKVSRKILQISGVEVVQLNTKIDSLKINFEK